MPYYKKFVGSSRDLIRLHKPQKAIQTLFQRNQKLFKAIPREHVYPPGSNNSKSPFTTHECLYSTQPCKTGDPNLSCPSRLLASGKLHRSQSNPDMPDMAYDQRHTTQNSTEAYQGFRSWAKKFGTRAGNPNLTHSEPFFPVHQFDLFRISKAQMRVTDSTNQRRKARC